MHICDLALLGLFAILDYYKIISRIGHRNKLRKIKGISEPHEVKKKSFDLGGNRTHDLRIRSTVTLPTELQVRTEKVGDDYRW